MRNFKYAWAIGLILTLAIIIIPIVLFLPRDAQAQKDPW